MYSAIEHSKPGKYSLSPSSFYLKTQPPSVLCCPPHHTAPLTLLTGRNIVLQKDDATLARIAVYRVTRGTKTRRKKQALVAYCDVDLASHFEATPQLGEVLENEQPSPMVEEWFTLLVSAW